MKCPVSRRGRADRRNYRPDCDGRHGVAEPLSDHGILERPRAAAADEEAAAARDGNMGRAAAVGRSRQRGRQ